MTLALHSRDRKVISDANTPRAVLAKGLQQGAAVWVFNRAVNLQGHEARAVFNLARSPSGAAVLIEPNFSASNGGAGEGGALSQVCK